MIKLSLNEMKNWFLTQEISTEANQNKNNKKIQNDFNQAIDALRETKNKITWINSNVINIKKSILNHHEKYEFLLVDLFVL